MSPITSALRLCAVSSLLASLALACSSTTSSPTPPPCNEDPWSCPSGQTCWVNASSAFACLNSGAGKKGDTCTSVAGAPACGDGLACLQTVAAAPGKCLAYCDTTKPERACGTGENCVAAAFNGNTAALVHLCVSTAVPAGDAGADAAAESGATDSGAD
jgi:hypothetical protein